MKTNAMRILEKAGISFRTVTYEVDEKDLSGSGVARKTAIPENRIFKTLVVKGDRSGYAVACIPVERELNLKSFAVVSRNKKVEMIPVKDIFPLTGYIRGGCSPVGMKKAFPIFFDSTAVDFDWIAVSAGIRGQQILVDPRELSAFVGAQYADITDSQQG